MVILPGIHPALPGVPPWQMPSRARIKGWERPRDSRIYTPVYAAPALVSAIGASSDSNGAGITTGNIDTTGATFLALMLGCYEPGAQPTISDNKGNTNWVGLSTYTVAGNIEGRLFYVVNPTVGTGHNFTASGAGSYPGVAVGAFSGVATVSPYYSVENGDTSTAVTSNQPGSITTQFANDLVLTGIGKFSSMSGLAIDSGFSVAYTSLYGGAGAGVSLAYLVQASAGAINPTWSWTTSGSVATPIATVKATAVAGTALPSFHRSTRFVTRRF